jgi:hypothetical protein
MPAATPQEAATKWEQNTQSGVGKYRAKLQQMYQNYASGLQRFWGVAPGPATTGAYQARVNEQAAARLGTNTQGKGQKWLTNSQAGVQR